MSESAKTLVFVAIALVLTAAAAVPRLFGPGEVELGERVNQQLFPDFTDPTEAKSIEIVEIDEELADLKSFKVAQVNDLWVIPSHSNYPADAEQKLNQVASNLIDLKVVRALTLGDNTEGEEGESGQPQTFAEFGVVEPDPEQIAAGDEGIGTLITIEDFKGDNLLQLIVGKEVDGTPEQRYVRLPGQDVIYVTKIDMSSLSTDFEDWIEKDLLHVTGFDIAKITLKDYSAWFDQATGPQYQPKHNIYLKADDGWELERLEGFGPDGKPFETSLSESEELNTEKLASLKTALDQLEIVDVQEKLSGASPQQQTLVLATKGFIPVEGSRTGEVVKVHANSGEVHITTKDGIEYQLYFGAAEQSDSGEGEGEQTRRYLMVSARVNEAQFPEPEYEELPPLPEEPAADAPADEGDGGGTQIDPVKVERERIQKENDRKREAWQEKRRSAADKVRVLNSRFEEYYYLVAEETFQDIDLSLSEIVKQKEDAVDSGFDVDSFRKLEQDGLPERAEP